MRITNAYLPEKYQSNKEREKMRRNDREVTDGNKIKEIIMSCDTVRLGINAGEVPYIVPLSFGYEEGNGKRFLYFHGAGEGRKIELLKKTGRAAFEMDTACRIVSGDKACQYTALYKSVFGSGRVEFIEDPEEKIKGLGVIMSHYTDRKDLEYADEMIKRVCVFRLEVEEISCKEHI